MSDAPSWPAAFVAMTFALGDTLEDAMLALSPEDVSRARTLAQGLGHKDREVRARTLAAAIAQIVSDLEEARLA